jgi:hypothetical protein
VRLTRSDLGMPAQSLEGSGGPAVSDRDQDTEVTQAGGNVLIV